MGLIIIPLPADAPTFSTCSINSFLKIAWYLLSIVKNISVPFFASWEGKVGSEILFPKPFLFESFDPLVGSNSVLYFNSKPDIPLSSILVKPIIWDNKFSYG